jgi:transcriptional regulator with XRE-family HTH domain
MWYHWCMDGKHKSAEILRSVRAVKGLTQRDLARLAHVPQPTIAAIESAQREPSLSLLSSIVESVGLSLHVTLVPLARLSAVNVARQLREVLHEEGDSRKLDDSALRLSLSFRDALRSADDASLKKLIVDPPDLVGDSRWDAFLAAVVEEECARRNVPTPRWVNDSARFAKPFWHLSGNPKLHHWELVTAPAAFVRHGVLVAAEELASV